MIGILIVTHQPLGSSLLHCIEHILGKPPALLVNYEISPQVDPDEAVSNLQAMLITLDQGSGVLILTDLYGATPANIAGRLLQSGKVECLTGLNLPMLLKAIQYQHQPLLEVVNKVLSGGQAAIFRMSAP